MTESTSTLNRSSVGGSRRAGFGFLYALSLFGLLVGIALIATAVSITVKSVSELSHGVTEHYWSDNWLVIDVVIALAGIAVVVGCSIAAGKFKREGDRDVSDVLS